DVSDQKIVKPLLARHQRIRSGLREQRASKGRGETELQHGLHAGQCTTRRDGASTFIVSLRFHSERRASAGSTLIARNAGIVLAATAAAINSIETDVYVTGSSELTPNNDDP